MPIPTNMHGAIVLMSRKGLSCSEIADKIGSNRQTVSKRLRALGVEVKRRPMSAYVRRHLAEIVKRYERGDALKDIARATRISDGHISDLAVAAGCKRRLHGGRQKSHIRSVKSA